MNPVHRFFSRSKAAWVLTKFPLFFLIAVSCFRLAPWWMPLGFYLVAEATMLYYQKIRVPAIRREFVCRNMFGFTTCPHGKYLPDTQCEPCAQEWLSKNQEFVSDVMKDHEPDCPVMPPKNTVFH